MFKISKTITEVKELPNHIAMIANIAISALMLAIVALFMVVAKNAH